MTPDEVVLMARRRYNSVGDNNYSDAELYDVIYAACLEVCDEAYPVERTYTTTTVSGTQGYDFPENAIAIKRATWDGRKLTYIDMLEDDAITGLNMTTTATGNPEFYFIWNRTVYLRPTPGSAATLKIWSFNKQGEISTGSTTIEIPEEHHARLVNPLLSAMTAKDQNYDAATYYLNLWEKDKIKIRQSMRRQKRADKFAVVKDEQMVVETYVGG